MLKDIDGDANGTVDFDEFMSLMSDKVVSSVILRPYYLES